MPCHTCATSRGLHEIGTLNLAYAIGERPLRFPWTAEGCPLF